MSKFNTKSSSLSKTVNLAGGKAYKQTSKLEFVSILLTSFVKDKFYRTAKDEINRLGELLNNIQDKKFLAKAAIFARTKFGMRSISHVAAAEIANSVKGEQWTKDFYSKVIHRPDDITEIMSYFNNKYGKTYPNSLKKGLAKSFDKFDAYQLAKYRGDGKGISLVDAVNYLHPKPVDKNKDALRDLVAGKLKSTETWESKLTNAGQKANSEDEKMQLKADAWKDLIRNKKLGYFALLRNLRNILQQAPDLIDEACEQLTNREAIKKSLVLPFRFSTAINEISSISGSRKVIIALNKALDISVENVPKFPGTTLVALDTSGSMEGNPLKIGSLFAAILVKSNDADFITFSDKAKYQTLNPMDSTLTIAKSIHTYMSGTNFNLIFNTANRKYDRVIILSDMQAWMAGHTPVRTFSEYKERYGANPKIYSFDLNGYGTTQFHENNIFSIAGFSEKIFDIMALLEQDKDALINEIEKIEL